MSDKTELEKDAHSLRSKCSNPRSDKQYTELKEKMKQLSIDTNRSFTNTMLYLLKLGLETEARNQKIINNG